MRLGSYGSGMIGGTLAKLWLAAGHEVRFGARDPERTRRKAPSINPRAGVGGLEETARWAEALLLAIPLTAALKAVCDNVKDLRPIGKFLGD